MNKQQMKIKVQHFLMKIQIEDFLKTNERKFVTSQSRHTFATPFDIKFNCTKYFQIIDTIRTHGPCYKSSTLIRCGMRYDQGFYSSVFAGLNRCGILEYNKKTHMWDLGPNYYGYMKIVNNFLDNT